MAGCYGIYAQGAIITRDDFDPAKVIPYLCKSYRIKLSDEILVEIKKDNLTYEHFSYLCKELEVNPKEKSAQSICNSALNPYEINDIFVDDAKIKVGNDMISARLYNKVEGEFFYDCEDRATEQICGEGMMLCFYVPLAWNIHDAIIPADKRIAVFQLQQASKNFLKDDIDWKQRLGTFIGAGFC